MFNISNSIKVISNNVVQLVYHEEIVQLENILRIIYRQKIIKKKLQVPSLKREKINVLLYVYRRFY